MLKLQISDYFSQITFHRELTHASKLLTKHASVNSLNQSQNK